MKYKNTVLDMLVTLLVLTSLSTAVQAATVPSSGKIVHYDLYSTDGYINPSGGIFPAPADQTNIAGWPAAVYIWGFTDIDPNIPGNLMTVPPGANAPMGGPVGNAKFPAPVIEARVGDDVYLTVHNRGFYQKLQKVQDDHSLHLHGIHAQAQYDGFPESAGSYQENLRYFWQEPNYLALGTTPQARDAGFNAMTPAQQAAVLAGTPLIKANKLNPAGGITNQFNLAPPPLGVGGLTPAQVEDTTQFTYYFKAQHPGTYMWHCHVAASEHVQMGMYGALIIRPADYDPTIPANKTVYGKVGAMQPDGMIPPSDTSFDVENIFIVSEFDPNWHVAIEKGTRKGFYPPNWKPELWFLNGRTFPQTIFKFAWNTPAGTPEFEPRYNTFVKVAPNQKFLIRHINMGYQAHPMHQHGWHMKIVGSDARPLMMPYEKFTLNIASGETYDAITTADPVYGVTATAGSPLSSPITPATNLNWRQIYPIHDHDDYKVTTNGIYPGGALALIEASGVSPSGTATWVNPYIVVPPPGFQPLPTIPVN